MIKCWKVRGFYVLRERKKKRKKKKKGEWCVCKKLKRGS